MKLRMRAIVKVTYFWSANLWVANDDTLRSRNAIAEKTALCFTFGSRLLLFQECEVWRHFGLVLSKTLPNESASRRNSDYINRIFGRVKLACRRFLRTFRI